MCVLSKGQQILEARCCDPKETRRTTHTDTTHALLSFLFFFFLSSLPFSFPLFSVFYYFTRPNYAHTYTYAHTLVSVTMNTDTIIHRHALPTPTASPPPLDMSPCYEEKPQQQRPPRRPNYISLFYKLIKTYDGRDKSIKIIQYLFKILLHHKLADAKRWSAMVSQFSMTRKILRLGVFLGPAQQLQSASSVWETIVLLNECSNNVADDIYCLYKMGLVGPRLGKRAEEIAYYCWFAAICVDLEAAWKKYQKSKSPVDLASVGKLSMDGMFCGKVLR